MKKNNKGFSLVELIVIIAIMAVLTTSIITYIGMIGTAEAKRCANGLSTGLSQTKVCAMSRSKASMIVYSDDTGASHVHGRKQFIHCRRHQGDPHPDILQDDQISSKSWISFGSSPSILKSRKPSP